MNKQKKLIHAHEQKKNVNNIAADYLIKRNENKMILLKRWYFLELVNDCRRKGK